MRYDEWLEALLRQLDSMGEYGKQTVVIVTTSPARLRAVRVIDGVPCIGLTYRQQAVEEWPSG